MNCRGYWIMGLCFLGILSSCDVFLSREKRTHKRVAKEMENIDWGALDHYPLFPECDELMTLPRQKQCFESSIIQYLTERINAYDLQLKDTIRSVIYLDLIVDREGIVRISDMERSQEILSQIPEFNRLIQREINALPQIEPALKRGVPVNAKFRIPIEFNPR